VFEAGQAHGEQRVVGQNRADPDHDGVVVGADEVRAGVGQRPGDHQPSAAAPCRIAVRGAGELQHHGGAPLRDPQHMAAMGPAGLVGQNAGDDLDPRSLEALKAGPMGKGARVRRTDHQAADAGLDEKVGAGGAVSALRARRAGFEGHVERGAPRGLARRLERYPLGMRPAAGLRRALTQDQAVAHHNGADGGVRPGEPEIARAHRKREAHVALVLRAGIGRCHRDPRRGGHASAVPAERFRRGASSCST
jgi:hypothetical protein